MSEAATRTSTADRGFVVEDTFHAPAAKVFAAYTEPHLIPKWWAPKGGSVTVESMDVRPGGAYRFIQRESTGQELVFVGKYLEVHPVTRLVYTFGVEGQGNEITATVELHEAEGRTSVRLTNLCASKEARDAMVRYGASTGAQAAWGRLSGLLSA